MAEQTKQIFLLHGPDTYQSWQRLQAIRERFLAQAESGPDLREFDIPTTESQVLKQALLTVPFFVTHRLFILKSPFGASKDMQQVLLDLLSHLPLATVVVLYEPKLADGRTKLFQWLKAHATVHAFEMPEGVLLDRFIKESAGRAGVTIAGPALQVLAQTNAGDIWQLVNEVTKIALYVRSNNRSQIEIADMEAIGSSVTATSVFGLTDALRDGDLKKSLRFYQDLRRDQDPMATAGMVAAFVRNLAKIVLVGTDRPQTELAKITGLHPYVVKLTMPLAHQQTKQSLSQAYARLITFERDVKEGRLETSLALLLLVIRLSGTLNRGTLSKVI
jgi:DNA polymerase III delta subunit